MENCLLSSPPSKIPLALSESTDTAGFLALPQVSHCAQNQKCQKTVCPTSPKITKLLGITDYSMENCLLSGPPSH